MIENSISIKTKHFDGPLGLLLHLVQKEEMDIKKLNINQITKEYLLYLKKMEELNFDVAGEYLYMAATLLLLKSRSCISEEEAEKLLDLGESGQGITSRAELIRRLEQLQQFQQLSQKIWELPRLGQDIYTRPKINKRQIINTLLLPMDLQQLTSSMMDFLAKEKRKYKKVNKDRLSIKDKLGHLKEVLGKEKRATLREIVDGDQVTNKKVGEKVNLVVTFISLLELARLKKVTIFQNEHYSDVFIDVIASLKDLDLDSADGFDSDIEEREGSVESLELIQ